MPEYVNNPRHDGPPSPNDERAPNLFIIGASKSASSALSTYLNMHPDVAMSSEKEPCFFVDQEELRAAWPIMARRPHSHDWEAYLSLWRGNENAAYRAEASVYYSQAPHRSGVPAAISSTCPNARIIYIVREPVTRAVSHYWQRVKEFQEPLSIEAAMRQHGIYRDTSDYALQLKKYLEYFDMSQIHIIISEKLRSHRVETLRECIEWLGLSPFEFNQEQLPERHVSPPASRRPLIPFVISARNSAAWAAIRERLPVRVVNKLRSYSTISFEKKGVDDTAAREYLSEYLAPRRAEFEKMIGKSIDVWPSA